jgi:predicted nucleic acid-binding protein
MPVLNKAILDTSALLSLYIVGALSYLNLLFTEVRIPEEVQREFLQNGPSDEEKSKRFLFLSEFYQDNDSWFIPCSEYGEDLISLYLTEAGMNRGEAEALAQNQFYDSLYTVVIDEKIARKIATEKDMQIRGTLRLLADMEVKHALINYKQAVTELRENHGTFFSIKIVNAVYEQAKRDAL